MLTWFAKMMLSLTALAPLAIIVGINKLSNKAPFWSWFLWILATMILVVICVWLILFIKRKGGVEPKSIKSIKNADQEVVAFLLAYLLPLFSKSNLSFTGNTLTGIVVLVIIFIAVVNSNSYHFNPLLGLLGYHFYEIVTENDMTFVLISRRCMRKAKTNLKVTEMTDYIYMDVGGEDA